MKDHSQVEAIAGTTVKVISGVFFLAMVGLGAVCHDTASDERIQRDRVMFERGKHAERCAEYCEWASSATLKDPLLDTLTGHVLRLPNEAAERCVCVVQGLGPGGAADIAVTDENAR